MILRFKHESERLQHPLVGNIPVSIWKTIFNAYLIESQQTLMNETNYGEFFVTLKKVIEPNPSADSKKKFWFCLAYGQTKCTDEQLIEFAERLKFTHAELFNIAAMLGNINLFDKVLNKIVIEVEKHLNKTEAPQAIMKIIMANNYEAFQWACQNGHLAIISKLIALAPEHLLKMIMANNFSAFRWASENGHLEILIKLKELAPEYLQKMIQANYFLPFRCAAEYGHIAILNQLIDWSSPEDHAKMITANGFNAIQMAAQYGHQTTINTIIDLAKRCNIDLINHLIKSRYWDYHQLMLNIVRNGLLNMFNEFTTSLDTTETKKLVMQQNYAFFQAAAENGHMNMLDRMVELVPQESLQAMIQAKKFSINFSEINTAPEYHAFHAAVQNGHLHILKKLAELAPDHVKKMIASRNYLAFRTASRNDNVPLMQQLIQWSDVTALPGIMQENDYQIIKEAIEHHCTNLLNYLLSFPTLFHFVAKHNKNETYGKAINKFIAYQITTLKTMLDMQASMMTPNQEGNIDAPEVQTAEIFQLILYYWIKENKTTGENLTHIDFLMSVPAVRTRLHLPILELGSNPLLREALRQKNKSMIERLIKIESVVEQAKQDNFYPTEQKGGINLKQLIKDDQSSTITLSFTEEYQLAYLKRKYHSQIQTPENINHIFESLIASLKERYSKNPAKLIIKVNNARETFLPESMQALNELASEQFEYNDRDLANLAYYEHPTHTALRFLSKPNPWISPKSTHHIESKSGCKWAPFEDFKPLICLFWLAASDQTEPATDGFTIETRIEEFIKELALIGRAQNWNNNNRDSANEYDDREGDKPSCYNGIRRRLFQSLKGHPLYKGDIEAIFADELRQALRAHVSTQLISTPTEMLESILIGCLSLCQSGQIRSNILDNTQALCPSESIINSWLLKLDEDNKFQSILLKLRQSIFTFEVDNNTFIKNLESCQLLALCKQELAKRSDTQINTLKTLTHTDRLAFLIQENLLTKNIRLVDLIQLGYLSEVGEYIGAQAFTTLLCKNEEDIAFYATVIADIPANEETLSIWLKALDTPNKQRLLDAIQKEKAKSSVSTLEQFKAFVRTHQTLGTQIAALLDIKASEDFNEAFLNWFRGVPPSPAVEQIYQKSQQLHLLTRALDKASATPGIIKETLPREERSDVADSTLQHLSMFQHNTVGHKVESSMDDALKTSNVTA